MKVADVLLISLENMYVCNRFEMVLIIELSSSRMSHERFRCFLRQNASPDVVKVLAANKCDATAHRAVDAERGQKIAENFDMPFFEVSCKENINIEEAAKFLVNKVSSRLIVFHR